MKLLTAIRLAWRYLRMPQLKGWEWTYGIGNNVYFINPAVAGHPGSWSLDQDNNGQVVIYTDHNEADDTEPEA